MSTTAPDPEFTPLPEVFRHCPRCGSAAPLRTSNNVTCQDASCGFSFYLNPACAVGAVLVDPAGSLLFIRRAKDPSKGLLGLPGGFIDAGETAEDALTREIQEEIGLHVQELRFLASFPNEYRYKSVMYSVLDFFYVAFLDGFGDTSIDPAEVEEIVVVPAAEVDYERIAFPSMKKAVAHYLKSGRG